MRAGSRRSRRSAGPPPAARRWIPGALSGHDDQPQQKSQRGAASTPEKKPEREPDDRLLKAKPQKLLKKRLVTPTRKEMGKNNKSDIKMLEMSKKKIKKNQRASFRQGKNFLPPMPRGRLLPSCLRLLAPGGARPAAAGPALHRLAAMGHGMQGKGCVPAPGFGCRVLQGVSGRHPKCVAPSETHCFVKV